MLSEVQERLEDLVGLTSKFCSTLVCVDCVAKQRRNPQNQKLFIRICVSCESLFLRKTLFEDFWNLKQVKDKEIERKQSQKEELERKINEQNARKEKIAILGRLRALEDQEAELGSEKQRRHEQLRELEAKLDRKEQELKALKARHEATLQNCWEMEEHIQSKKKEIETYLRRVLDARPVEILVDSESQKSKASKAKIWRAGRNSHSKEPGSLNAKPISNNTANDIEKSIVLDSTLATDENTKKQKVKSSTRKKNKKKEKKIKNANIEESEKVYETDYVGKCCYCKIF